MSFISALAFYKSTKRAYIESTITLESTSYECPKFEVATVST